VNSIHQFVAEARRRRVFRTLGLYIVGAWALLQVADLALESMDLPGALLRFFWYAAFAGFPIAAIFGWFYDITAAGITKTPSASENADVNLAMGVPDYAIIAALAVVVGVAAAGLFDRARQAEFSEPPYDRNSVAVMPLDNLSGDQSQEYFSAGIQDALITKLSKVGSLRVVSRNSTARLDRTLSMPAIGELLGTRNIVEGSVMREGNRVRVIVQLIDAPKDTHIWADSFERESSSVLALQNDVARSIAGALSAELSADEEKTLSTAANLDANTYDKYLRGMYMLDQADNLIRYKGVELLESLVDSGQADARVYAALAYGYAVLGHSPTPEGMYPASKLAARRAMELDSTMPEVHLAIGMQNMYYERNFEAARRSLQHALDLNPSLTGAQYHLAWLWELYRDSERALPPGDRTIELDPLSPKMRAWLAEQYRAAGQVDMAKVLAEEALELAPGDSIALLALSLAQAQAGDFLAALETAQRLQGHPVWGYVYGVVLALAGQEDQARQELAAIDRVPHNVLGLYSLHAILGDVDDTFYWMDVAKEIKLPWYPWMVTWFPVADEVRNDPRMDEHAEEIGLTDALARARSLQ
jgi:TolB-like protein/Tfp pilus assembly protein PilF